MHSLHWILFPIAILLLFSCGNKGDLYLDSSKALEQELEVFGEALDLVDEENAEEPAESSAPRKRRPGTETETNSSDDSSS